VRLGGVKSDVVISSVCRVSQSMRKSGNAATRLFLTLITDQISDILVLESISILTSVPPLAPHHRVNRGHTDDDRGHRLLISVYILVSLLGFGILIYDTISVVSF
jgi:hypothetical protein